MQNIIEKKRDRIELSREEIIDFVEGFTAGVIPDYQVSAFAMAVYFNGMTLNEMTALTEAMLKSGARYELSSVPGVKVDKHSTGGIGDKVSLILAPLAAACGLTVPMMAGRGLGYSGGTIDKLESIPGFTTELPKTRFEKILSDIRCAIISQSNEIAPADKKLYGLRDVTGTVECIPLIVASILSKKLAEGTHHLVLDVKVGNGAFMKTLGQARRLAKTLIQVGKRMDLPCRVLLTNMNQPLGYAVGNSLEVFESIEILRNERNPELSSADLRELTVNLCAQMLVLGKKVKNLTDGRKLAASCLEDGSAWQVFQKMVTAQNGNLEAFYEKFPNKIPGKLQDDQKPLRSNSLYEWRAKKKGYISKINAETVGRILVEMGGGRKKASDPINRDVGLIFHKKLGGHVQVGDPLVTVYAKNGLNLDPLEAQFQKSVEISTSRKPVSSLILEQH